MVVGDLFTRDAIATEPCPRCGAPAVTLDDGPCHFEQLPNGAKTSWTDCKPADLARIPTLF